MISQDPNRCKSYEPRIAINPVSDANNMLLHFHFNLEPIHFNILHYKNYKQELLNQNNKTSLYNEYVSNTYYALPFMNKLKTNATYISSSKQFNNPYNPSLKLNGLLTI